VRVLLVANPLATSASARQRDVAVRAIASEADLEIVETANRGHAAALACRAMRHGGDVVVGIGGDGTINEIINGLLTDGLHENVPALGLIPAGSTNVFARALGIPDDTIEATGDLLAGLRSGYRRPVSLGQADDRWFCFAAGMGFDAAVVGAVERKRRIGKRSTHALYAAVGVREFFHSDRRHPRLHVELPGGERLDDIYFAIVANADPWTYLGSRPLRPTPGVTFANHLGIYARRRMGTVGMLWSIARLSGDRPHIGRRGAFVASDVEHLTLLADEPLPFQVDGDYMELREKVTFRSAVGALRVVLPPRSLS
jgi:diacylglycerol kinase family enzyme